MTLLDGTERCTLEACESGVSISMGGAPFCLEHFVSRCYELLQVLDPRIRNRRGEIAELSTLRESIEECSNSALLVSLRAEALTNLNRSRLLDILLWSSDLLFLLNISARDFDLLTAFRRDSDLAPHFELQPSVEHKAPSGSKDAKEL
jgi:hypothetical protein